jgi:hypothetical protein
VLVSPWLQPSGLETALVGIALYNDAGTVKWRLVYYTNGGGMQMGAPAASPLPATDTWYCVEVYWKRGAGTGVSTAWVDGTQVGTATGLTNTDYYAQIGTVGGYNWTGNTTITVFSDCAVVADAYIGPETENNLEVDNLTVNNELKLLTEAPKLSNQNLLNFIWSFDGSGVWQPQFLTIPHGTSYLHLKNTDTENYAELSLVLVEGSPNPEEYDALHAFSHSVVVKKDLAAGGMLSSNQGALAVGSGFTSMIDVPRIWLLHSNRRRLIDAVYQSTPPGSPANGDYYVDTDNNHLYQWDGSTWVNLGDKNDFDIVDRLASDPESPQKGQLYVNTGDNHLKMYNGSSWDDKGSKSNYQGYFDTLYIHKADGITSAHVDMGNANIRGNASINGHLGVGDTVISSLNPAPGYVLGTVPNPWAAVTALEMHSDSYRNKSGTAEYISSTGVLANVTTNAAIITSGEFASQRINWDEIQSSVYPNTTDTYSLGSGEKRWLGANIKDSYIDKLILPKAGGENITWNDDENAFFHFYTKITPDDAWRRYLDIVAIGDQDGYSGGACIRFLTNPVGSDTATERMRVDRDGTIYVKNGSQESFKVDTSGNIYPYGSCTPARNGNSECTSGHGDARWYGATIMTLYVDAIDDIAAGYVQFNADVRPSGDGNLNFGTDSKSWNSIWTSWLNFTDVSGWDASDDLALVKGYKMKTKNVVVSRPDGGTETVEINVIDLETLPFLRAFGTEKPFWDMGKSMGFLFGCAKFEVLAREKLEERVSKLETLVNQKGGNN